MDTFPYMYRKAYQVGAVVVVGVAMVLLGSAEAKPDKGGGNKGKGGGPPAHAGGGKSNDKKKDKGGPPGHAGGGKAKDKGRPDIVVYGDKDRGRVLDYFGGHQGHPHGLPPGLAKKIRDGKPLPPGWQKKLTPGWVIVDDWWPRFVPLSYEWFPNLPVIQDTRLYLYGDRVVRVYEPRREVIDVIVVPTIHIDR